MPDSRRHRGARPSDRQLFDEAALPALRGAVHDLSWLLSRGYAITSALKLVGDRHALNARQRAALSRAVCSDQDAQARQTSCVPVEALKGKPVILDGFNLLILVESALSGGLLVLCRDECIRDLASVYGSYRSVEETDAALTLIGNGLRDLEPLSVAWVFDQPVSNSGRLAQRVRNLAARHGWPWTVEVALNPDRVIADSPLIAISSDSSILDQVGQWVNFSAYLVKRSLSGAWLIDLR